MDRNYYESGKSAFNSGRPASTCPFSNNTPERREWMTGYFEATQTGAAPVGNPDPDEISPYFLAAVLVGSGLLFTVALCVGMYLTLK